MELHSVENDQAWARQVCSLCGGDNRFRMTTVDGPISNFVGRVNVKDYDIDIYRRFVDSGGAFRNDSRSGAAESGALLSSHSRFSGKNLPDLWLVGCKTHLYSTPLFLKVGVLWNGNLIQKRDLQKICKLISRNANRFNAADREFWLQVLSCGQITSNRSFQTQSSW